MTGEFELDHFQPQSIDPQLRLDYSNLVYACRRCNRVKLNQIVDDPFLVLCSASIALLDDGSLHPRDGNARRLLRRLDLNSPRLRQWRVMWTRITALAEERDSGLYSQLAGFPTDLPDLRRLKPPKNDREEGIELSWFVRRERGELPSAY